MLAAIVVFGTSIYGIATGVWSLALVMLLCGGVYFMIHRSPAPQRTIGITEQGFTFGEQFTRWEECEDFWFIRGHGYIELHIRRKKGWGRNVVIQTGNIDPLVNRAILSHFLPEQPKPKEKVLDILIRICQI